MERQERKIVDLPGPENQQISGTSQRPAHSEMASTRIASQEQSIPHVANTLSSPTKVGHHDDLPSPAWKKITVPS